MVDVEGARSIAAGRNVTTMLSGHLITELFQRGMVKARGSGADIEARVALLLNNALQIVDGVRSAPVFNGLTVALVAHVNVPVLRPVPVSRRLCSRQTDWAFGAPLESSPILVVHPTKKHTRFASERISHSDDPRHGRALIAAP